MKKTSILSTLLISSLTFSQVGVNTSNPQAALHVDGAKDNSATGIPTASQQANDFSVTNSGNVGIGTIVPSTKVHVNSAVSPAVRIVDGTEGIGKVLISDANGNANWANSSATKPTIGGILPTTTSNMDDIWRNINVNITLPPGNWLVQMGTTIVKNTSSAPASWVLFSLCESQTTFGNSPDIDLTRSGFYVAGNTAPPGDNVLSFVSGVIAINNSSAGNKTYYLWGRRANGSGVINSPFSSTVLERYFYAIPVN